jgi:hypothetical protein
LIRVGTRPRRSVSTSEKEKVEKGEVRGKEDGLGGAGKVSFFERSAETLEG